MSIIHVSWSRAEIGESDWISGTPLSDVMSFDFQLLPRNFSHRLIESIQEKGIHAKSSPSSALPSRLLNFPALTSANKKKKKRYLWWFPDQPWQLTNDHDITCYQHLYKRLSEEEAEKRRWKTTTEIGISGYRASRGRSASEKFAGHMYLSS